VTPVGPFAFPTYGGVRINQPLIDSFDSRVQDFVENVILVSAESPIAWQTDSTRLDSVVAFGGLHARDDDEMMLVDQKNNSYELFLSSGGNQTTLVELDFLNSWVHVVSSTAQQQEETTGADRSPSLQQYATSHTTNTRCDKLATGSFLAKASGTFRQEEGTDDSTARNLLEQSFYRPLLAKLFVGVSSRILSAPLLGPAIAPYHRTITTEKKVHVTHNHGCDFFQAKSIMSGEFFHGDATTVKIGNSASSGEETAITTDIIVNNNNSSIRSSNKIGYGSRCNTINNAPTAVVRTNKKKGSKSRMLAVATWKKSLATLEFPTSSTANKRLLKGKQIIPAKVVASPKKMERGPSVKHLGIFNFDHEDFATAPSLSCAAPLTTATANNGRHARPPHLQPRLCNVVVKTVQPESRVEIQFWTDALARTSRTYGNQHAHTRLATLELGTAYLKNGDSENAVQTLQLLLDTLQCDDKRQSLVAAVILEKLGCALATPTNNRATVCQPSQASKALEHLRRALQIRCRLLGPLHVDSVECLNTIAAVYFRWEDFINAQGAYYEVLVLRQAIFGQNVSGLEHPSVAVTAQQLGQVHARLSELETALEYYQMAERIYNSWQVPKENRSFASLQRCLKSILHQG
jgi:hypothetical protein